MPWPHCDDPAINDDLPCPACGMTKAEWTIKVKVTRVLRVGKGFTWKFELRDGAGEYAAGARWQLTLADGRVEEGVLTSGGYGKVTSKLPGDAVLSFPEHGAAVSTSTPEARPGVAPGEFVCPPSKTKYEFRLGAWVEVGLRDPWGDPCAREPFVVRLADGALREGRLDDLGLARVEDVTAPVVEVRFPERDAVDLLAAAFVELELVDEEGLPVPDEPFEARLGSGEVRTGTLDAQGRARIEGLCGAEVHVTFPGREQLAWGGVGHFALPDAFDEQALDPIDLELLDTWGRPAAREPFALRHPDGREERGFLDGRGRARVWAEAGCEVSFPAREPAAWARVGAPAPAQVEIALVDAAGRPVPRARFVLRQDGREVYRGRLGRDGQRRVEGLEPGPVDVSFPDLDPAGWARFQATPPPPPPPRQRWLEVALVDPAGRPVPREPYEVRLPDGSILAGLLDQRGKSRLLVGVDPAACEVRFPARDPRGWRRRPDDHGPGEPWLELALVDPWGRPAAREPFQVRLPGGEILAGRLDRAGRRLLTGVPRQAVCEVTFPAREPAAWARV